MTRTATWLGAGLGALLLLRGLGGGTLLSPSPAMVTAIGLGIAVFVCASLAARGSGTAQLVLIGFCLSVLAWQLPVYFSSYQVWPGLVLVALASGTFGFGLLGYLLDRHPGGGGPGDRL